jgi:endogenous inhibitor of DNA gyrase (YacG/DUF329 family)
MNNAIRPNTGGRGRGGPRSRMCYVCGRQTLLAGYDWHVTQCKDLFIKREELKPRRERRPIPQDPMLSFAQAGGQLPGHGGTGMRQGDLDAYNEHAEQAYKATLTPCQFCGRTFADDKLAIHNRSCTAEHPAKSVNRGGGAGPGPAPAPVRSGHATIANPGSCTASRGGEHLPDISQRPDSNQGARTTGSLFGQQKKQKSMSNVRFKEEESEEPPRPLHGGGGHAAHAPPSYEDYEQNVVPAMMVKCPDCGRQFNEEAYSHHANICKKVFGQARTKFDSSKHRTQGTDMETVGPRKPAGSRTPLKRPGSRGNMAATVGGGGGGGGDIGSNSMPKSKGANWKNQSHAFRDAIKAARQISIAERHAKATGQPLASVLPPANVRSPDDPAYDDYVQCPHCGRKYNQKAGARHIPQCKNIFAKPSRLKKGTGQVATSTRY